MPKTPKWPRLTVWCWFGVSFVSACTTVVVPDIPVCEDLTPVTKRVPDTGHIIMRMSPACTEHIGEPACGHCTYIVSGREIFIGEKIEHRFNGRPWSEVRGESVILPAVESYAPLAAYLKLK